MNFKRDKIVFDIETKNTFDEVGGYQNLKDLEISVVGIYSYLNEKYYCFEEKEINKLEDFFKNANLLIGFSSKSFDVPVLEKYFDFKISAINHFDILEEIQKEFKRKVGLNILAQANIGKTKLFDNGIEAIKLYRNGQIEELKNYCLQDVKLTKELFDLIREKGYLWVPQKDLIEMTKVKINFNFNFEDENQGYLF